MTDTDEGIVGNVGRRALSRYLGDWRGYKKDSAIVVGHTARTHSLNELRSSAEGGGQMIVEEGTGTLGMRPAKRWLSYQEGGTSPMVHYSPGRETRAQSLVYSLNLIYP